MCMYMYDLMAVSCDEMVCAVPYVHVHCIFVHRMAPEVVVCETNKDSPYDSKVWTHPPVIICILAAVYTVHGVCVCVVCHVAAIP